MKRRKHVADLSTTYMGLKLENPLLVASSSISKTIDGVIDSEKAGAGAIVIKSLFEEQVQAEIDDIERSSETFRHPEAIEYVERMGVALGPTEYLKLIGEAKKRVAIPVIASLNCVSTKVWMNYARRLVDAGADALELNISLMPSDPKQAGADIEKVYYDITEMVKKSVNVPVAVKLAPYFTSMANMARMLERRGADALVLFNRLYQLDIDIEKLDLAPGYKFSSPGEINVPLRWISLLAGRIEIDIAASTGVHDAAGVIKDLLAGAAVVQLCSTLYINGLDSIGLIRSELERWMDRHGFGSIGDFRGKLSQSESDNPESYERLQYIKALVGIE
jgi:dihydroorotate dehydrogenase (fumarate)